MNADEYGQELPLAETFDKGKHIGQIGDLLILLALRRTKWKADGLRVVELLKEFHIEMSDNYVRRRHLEKPELYGRKTGQLEVTDLQIKQQVSLLMRVIRALPDWKRRPPPPLCIRDDTANYYAWTPSRFGMQAATDEEREVEERRRARIAALQVEVAKKRTNPLIDRNEQR